MSLVVSEVAGLQTSKYFNVAGAAILIFDYVVTFEDEVRWVWGRSWDTTRFVFTVSRYLPFVGVGLTAYAALRSNSDPCGPSLAENIIHILGVIAAEVLLILRTCAFWQGDKRVLFGLLAYASLSIGGAVAINVMPWHLLPDGTISLPGCPLVSSRNSTFVYLFVLIFEIVILSLMSWRRFRAYRQVKASIVRIIYRDGMFYVVCIIFITFANIIVDGIFPLQFSDLLDIPQITLHSVLASRIVFNLRKNAERAQGRTTTTEVIFSEVDYVMPSSQHTATSDSLESSTIDIRVDSDIEVPPPISNV